MTVLELKKKFPADILDSLTESDDSVVSVYLSEAETFLNAIVALTDEALKDIHKTTYVIYRLYERFGYQEQAQAYFDRMMQSIKHTTGVTSAAPSEYQIQSESEYFTTALLDKW